MAERWTLERAGITNVYQYGDEVLRFGGGRLLLRGVNGSGKSTAMNMLLPFLLEADTRRIDAAGEQAGVLRSWMLSGRDEPQPVGYLWVEFRRSVDGGPADYLTCGCGIRASRSTDRVTTWWFVTPRRPGIDVALVEAKTPRSIDALRAELGPNAVFAHDQRGAYRAEVRNKLYGGADLDQHLRLLHVVRNPRVGDRIDVDLPSYLQDALPQLSEAALDDAAQPLEDLEEHRRNVEDLTRTATALEALDATYRDYARTELHARARAALELVTQHRARTRDEAAIRTRRTAAEAERDRAADTIEAGEADARRLRHEIETLKARDAYKAGADLTDLRDHVASLTAAVDSAQVEVDRADNRRVAAKQSALAAARDVAGDTSNVRDRLADLTRLHLHAGLTVRPPDVPTIQLRPGRSDELELPMSELDLSPTRRSVGDLRAAGQSRAGDVREVRGAIVTVERALAAVTIAEREATRAEHDAQAARDRAIEARATRDATVVSWRESLRTWAAKLTGHEQAHDVAAAVPTDIDGPDLAERRDDVAAALFARAHAAVEHHGRLVAALDARLDAQQRAAIEAEAHLAELLARALPDPPLAAWQHERRRPCLAEVVDFHAHVTDARRAGLEAAMEAAGLLSAEVRGDGLVLADGQLVARAGKPAEMSLASLLFAAGETTELNERVTQILDSISVDPELFDSGDDLTLVATDGRFRVGVLHGRHAKATAEHIGIAARRATLDRQRTEAEAVLVDASAAVTATETERAQRRRLGHDAAAIRKELPSPTAVADAVVRLDLAEQQADDAITAAADRRRDLTSAEEAHGRAADELRRVAATLGLPHDIEGLDDTDRTLRELSAGCDLLGNELGALARSVQQWMQRGGDWEQAVDDADAAAHSLLEATRAREQPAIKLATLEDTVGAEYDEIVQTIAISQGDLDDVGTRIERAQQERLDAHGAALGLAAEERSAAELRHAAQASCLASLEDLRRTMAVPGLLPSALHGDESDDIGDDGTFPTVTEDPAGLHELAGTLAARVPAPARGAVSAESVRQSLRQRRDAIGAGWDAEDHQPHEALPLHVEVTGPLARAPLRDAAVRVQGELRSKASLLSAQQDQALRNLLQGLIAREVAEKLHAARELVVRMNRRLDTVTTSHGIGVSLRWQRRDDLDESLATTIALLSKAPDLRTADEDRVLTAALSERIAEARREDPDAPYRDLIGGVLDYREWHRMGLVLHRPGRDDERLSRRTALSEGEKKMVSYLPLFAAVAASCDALAEGAPDAPRFVLLDDAFAKVSEDNHPKLFGLLVELDLDFIATSERLWGTHATGPELAITEVLRDADLGVIVLEHSRWDGATRSEVP
jgi:uncharacterized protein (TIGR02680 family)